MKNICCIILLLLASKTFAQKNDVIINLMLVNNSETNKYGYQNERDEWIIAPIYDGTSEFKQGVAVVEKEEKYAVINYLGQEIVPLGKYIYMCNINNNGLILCMKDGEIDSFDRPINGKWGFIDKFGKEVIPFIYDEGYNFDEYGLAIMVLNGKGGIIDTKGKIVTPFKYSMIGTPFGKGFRVVGVKRDESSNYGIIDNKNNVIVPVEDQFFTFQTEEAEGLIIVMKTLPQKEASTNGSLVNMLDAMITRYEYGIMNYECEFIVPLMYREIQNYYNKYAVSKVEIKGEQKYGVIDTKGDVVISFEYDDIQHYSCGLFCVCKEGKYGYVNDIGELVIPLKYDYAGCFYGGVAEVEQGEKQFYIDMEDKRLPYQDMVVANLGFAGIGKNAYYMSGTKRVYGSNWDYDSNF